MIVRLAFLTGMTALCAGCASGGDFPSLAPRAVERLSFDEPEREPPVIAPDPSLIARIEALAARARAGDADFQAMARGVERAVAAAAAPGSESWIVAQQAVSRLEASRRETVAALADLDALAVERANLPTNADDMRAIEQAAAAAAALAEAQARRIRALKSRL